MKYRLYILTVIISITSTSCSSYSKQEEQDFNKLIVGRWKSIGEQQTTEHIINSDRSINTHWSFGSVGGLEPSDHYRKWEIKGDTLIIIDKKTSYKELILDVTQDSLILQSIDDNILGNPETFIRSY